MTKRKIMDMKSKCFTLRKILNIVFFSLDTVQSGK